MDTTVHETVPVVEVDTAVHETVPVVEGDTAAHETVPVVEVDTTRRTITVVEQSGTVMEQKILYDFTNIDDGEDTRLFHGIKVVNPALTCHGYL